MTTSPVVVSLCDHTGKMVRPWADAGYECWCIDLQHPKGRQREGNIVWWGEDILEWFVRPGTIYAIAFGFPPCTDLAASGARWWKGKGLNGLSEAIRLVARCAELFDLMEVPWMIENPIGSLSSYWRQPDAKFDPCDYGGYLTPPGDEYTKRTCLWTGNGFVVPLPKPVFPYEGSRMHLIPPSEDRANLRSETPEGFAKAVFLANEPLVRLRIPVCSTTVKSEERTNE
jgi:hypothetical protein